MTAKITETVPQGSTEYLEKIISHPRMVALQVNKRADALLTISTLDQDGKTYENKVVQILAEGKPSNTTLIQPQKGIAVQALTDTGDVFFTAPERTAKADYEGAQALYKLGARGEAEQVLTFPAAFQELAVRQVEGKDLIVFIATQSGKDLKHAAHILETRKKTAATAVLHTEFPTRYWDQDLDGTLPALWLVKDGQEPQKIATPAGKIAGFELSEDGAQALVCVQTKLRGIHQRHSTYLVDLSGEQEPQPIALATETHSFFPGEFSPGGQRAFVLKESQWLRGQSLNMELTSYDFASGEFTELASDLDRWPSSTVWLSDEEYAFSADNLGAGAIYRGKVGAAKTTQLTDDQQHYTSLRFGGGKIFALQDAHQHSARPVAVDPVSGQVSELDSPVEPLVAAGRLEHISATAVDGTTVTSWLCLPEEKAGAEGYPLIVFAHGGPWGSWNSWTYRWNPWVLTDLGYAVLLPDPAISTGYGQKMIDRGGDSVGDAPYTDIMALVAQAEVRKDIDQNRSAFMGGSYGGYMTNWVAGHEGTRFKCYVTHASLWNMDVQNSITDNGVWHEWMIEGEGQTQGDQYSPHLFAQNIKAPMLVVHGDRDYRVHIANAHQLWLDLHRFSPELGHQFLYYPDEGHWILKPANSRLWYQSVIAFLNQHVLGKDYERPELLQ